MTLVAVGSLRGSPGVTTLALALATAMSPGALVVEADPDGGVLAARHGLSIEPGLLGLAGRARRGLGPDDVTRSLQHLPGGVPVLVTDPNADVAAAGLSVGGAGLAAALREHDTPVVVDVGRLRVGSPALPFVHDAGTVLVVARPEADELAALARRLPTMAEPVQVVLVGERPYSRRDVEALGLTVAGTVPRDARTAAALAGRAPFPRRSPLLQAAAALVATMSPALVVAR